MTSWFFLELQQTRSSSVMSTKQPQPEVQVIKLHKNANGMGLSIVAAKGAGQVRFLKIIFLQPFFHSQK